ncbi:MAG: heat-shock protein [Rhodospirillaceae bacterium BRH_c57]|nr:MAG: heat-shock protein [Rhodospirillaceae bacterium BRH_c57]
MRTFDLSPLHRVTVGFDNMSRLLDAALRLEESGPAYPPYNIEKRGEDTYRVSMAVAGFSEDDLDITMHDNSLIIRGRLGKDAEKGEAGKSEEGGQRQYLHHGIATRAFERRFQLADHIKVTGASLVNGLLHVELKREVPEEKKPRKIEIARGPAPKALEHQNAA